MAEASSAAPRSPIASLADAIAEARAGDAVLVERPARTRLNLRLDPDLDADALTAAGAALGGALPLTPRAPAGRVDTAAVTARGWTVLWLGPDDYGWRPARPPRARR